MAFRQAVKIRPESADAHNDLGLALLQIGDAGNSIQEFQAALRLKPNDPGYEGNLGAAYLQNGF